MIFLGIELVGIPGFIFTGYLRNAEKSGEAAVKFFLIGAFSSAMLAVWGFDSVRDHGQHLVDQTVQTGSQSIAGPVGFDARRYLFYFGQLWL